MTLTLRNVAGLNSVIFQKNIITCILCTPFSDTHF